MRKSTLSVLVVLALLAVAWSQGGQPKADDSKVLVVDVQHIIDESEEGREFVGRLRQKIAEKKKQIDEQVRALQESTKKLMERELPERDAKWYADVEKALAEQNRLKTEEQFFVAKVNDDIARSINELLRGAMETAKKIMRERGASIVLGSRMKPLQINNDQQLQEEVVLRRVICAKDEINITLEVLARMNKWYRENKKGN